MISLKRFRYQKCPNSVLSERNLGKDKEKRLLTQTVWQGIFSGSKSNAFGATDLEKRMDNWMDKSQTDKKKENAISAHFIE